MQTVNGWLTLFWIAMIPVSIWTGWVKSITYVSALSLWALVSGHWSTWQASRVEVHQQEDADVQEVLDVVKGQERPGRPDYYRSDHDDDDDDDSPHDDHHGPGGDDDDRAGRLGPGGARGGS